MSYYVRKSVGDGSIRFGAATRNFDRTHDPRPSTGTRGEFVRRGPTRLYFGEEHRPSSVILPGTRTSRRQRLFPDALTVGLVVLGGLFVVMGIAVIVSKGAHGWVEVILGLAIIASPYLFRAKRRRDERKRLEAERKEREAREAEARAIIGSFGRRLEELPSKHDPSTLEEIRRERTSRDIAYAAVRDAARDAVLHVGFAEVGRSDSFDPARVADAVESSAEAVGLAEEDRAEVRLTLYQTVLWHIVADDRLDEANERRLDRLRAALGIDQAEVASELEAIEQFRRLRGLAPEALPKLSCPLDLAGRELCHEQTAAQLIADRPRFSLSRFAPNRKKEGSVAKEVTLYVTSTRLILQGEERREIDLARIFEVEVDADARTIEIALRQDEEPLLLELAHPIYTASIIEMARARATSGKFFAA